MVLLMKNHSHTRTNRNHVLFYDESIALVLKLTNAQLRVHTILNVAVLTPVTAVAVYFAFGAQMAVEAAAAFAARARVGGATAALLQVETLGGLRQRCPAIGQRYLAAFE